MIHSFTLYTDQIDVPADAVAEIRDLLSRETLKKNAVGVVICHADYVENGTYALLVDALPFPLVGATTFAQATAKGAGQYDLSITVLTSDDACFAAAQSGALSLGDDLTPPLEAAYREAFAVHGKRPSLILNFAPLNFLRPGDAYVKALNEITDHVPLFGTFAVDVALNPAHSYTLCGAGAAIDRDAMLLIIDAEAVDFEVAYYPRQSLFNQLPVITKSRGNMVEELDGKPFSDFIARNNLTMNDLSSIPIIMDPRDGSEEVSRIVLGITEAGAMFASEMPEGASLKPCSWNAQAIVNTSEKAAEDALQKYGADRTYFMFACLNRYMELGGARDAELNAIAGRFGPSNHFVAAYAGSEISPFTNCTPIKNHLHNNALILCALK